MTQGGLVVYKAAMTRLKFTAGEEDAGLRLDSFLSQKADGLSRSRAKAMIKDGQAFVAGVVTDDPRGAVAAGTVYELVLPDPVPARPEPEAIPLDILFEDGHLLVVNKPAGMTVHPAPGNWTGTLVNALLHHCEGSLPGIGGVERPGIVHRIDRLTSGILVVAKTDAAHMGLSELFASHDIERAYLAVTRGAPRPLTGTVDAPIARSRADRKKMAVARNPEAPGARRAVTHYKVLEAFGQQRKGAGLPAAALVECRLETGRTHQIRVHMGHTGAPLLGDPVYGRQSGIRAEGYGEAVRLAVEAARGFTRQALHAAMLGFHHPVTGEDMRFEAALPQDMQDLVGRLRALPGR